MGELIDLHERSPFKDMPEDELRIRYTAFEQFGGDPAIRRHAHRMRVELFHRLLTRRMARLIPSPDTPPPTPPQAS